MTDFVDVVLLRLDTETDDDKLAMPRRMRVGDAAADLPARHDTTIGPMQRQLVPTGFALAIPDRHCGLILPRSGLALNHGLTVLNSPGLIDSGYRGELQVLLINLGEVEVPISRGQRIAQLLVVDVATLGFVEGNSLPDPPDDRGIQGFGSSGA